MKKEITNLNELIMAYRDEALSMDFEKEYLQAYKIYQLKKLKLNNAEAKDEKDEIINEIQKAIRSLKHDLLNVIMNEHYKAYINGTPTFVSRIRLYLMYNELLPAEKDGKQEPEEKKEFKDFFNLKNISDKQIEVIQSKFKNSKGKEMAMLIYELSKRDLIEIIENSKMQGRKHFIQSLNKNIKRETGINYYLRQGANGLELNNTNEKDDYYKNVSNEISEILK